MADLSVEGTQGPCSPIVRILPFRDKHVDYNFESICEAEPKSFEIAGQKPEACEVSLEILGFRRMIRCEVDRPLAYFVGIQGSPLQCFE